MAINLKNAAWFMKYQPKTVDDLVFDNDDHKTLVNNWLTNGKINGNVLFYGKAGLGKTATTELLIKNIIKVQNDLFKSSERSVKMIDEKLRPFLTKKPVKSSQKIVYLEEIDRMSSTVWVALKEGLMEKYQSYVSFICCTNYHKKIDKALMTRFTYKIPFSGQNIDGITDRLKIILDNENAQYDNEKLEQFVKKSYKSGIRELINILQKDYISNNGIIEFNTAIGSSDNLEERVFKLIMDMLAIIGKASGKDKSLCVKAPINSIISGPYCEFINIIQNNMDINYDYIFEKLVENTFNFIPLNMIASKYGEMGQGKMFPHAHVVACLSEMMKCVIEISG